MKDQLYPSLLENSTNIEEAKMMLKVTSMTIQQALLNYEKKVMVSDLEIPPVAAGYEKFTKIMSILTGETARNGLDLCQGMMEAIDSFIREENTSRPLSELKATLLD